MFFLNYAIFRLGQEDGALRSVGEFKRTKYLQNMVIMNKDTKKIKVSKKQHFVPREYLEYWTVDNNIAMVRDGEPEFVSLGNVGHENYFYKYTPLTFTDVQDILIIIQEKFPYELHDVSLRYFIGGCLSVVMDGLYEDNNANEEIKIYKLIRPYLCGWPRKLDNLTWCKKPVKLT